MFDKKSSSVILEYLLPSVQEESQPRSQGASKLRGLNVKAAGQLSAVDASRYLIFVIAVRSIYKFDSLPSEKL